MVIDVVQVNLYDCLSADLDPAADDAVHEDEEPKVIYYFSMIDKYINSCIEKNWLKPLT